jgi:hypothetical protein
VVTALGVSQTGFQAMSNYIVCRRDAIQYDGAVSMPRLLDEVRFGQPSVMSSSRCQFAAARLNGGIVHMLRTDWNNKAVPVVHL